MKHLLVILGIGIVVSGCKEKAITIKEFKENSTLRAEWLQKCKDDSGFEEGSCRNAYEAEEYIKNMEIAEKYKKLGGIE